MLEILDHCLVYFSSIFKDISWVRYGETKIVFNDVIEITVVDETYRLNSEFLEEEINIGSDPVEAAVDLLQFIIESVFVSMEAQLREAITKDEPEEKPAKFTDKYRKNNKL